MSFYHILPSNTSPETFPANNASAFSTLIENPYLLQGNWEVALVNLTHSNCIYTFNDENIKVTTLTNDLCKIVKHCLFKLPTPTKRKELCILTIKM